MFGQQYFKQVKNLKVLHLRDNPLLIKNKFLVVQGNGLAKVSTTNPKFLDATFVILMLIN